VIGTKLPFIVPVYYQRMFLSTLRRTFQQRPLLANIVTFTGLLSAGDVTSQVIENKGLKNFKFERLGNMATMGVVYYGPVLFYYYRYLDRKLPGKDRKTILVKMFIDQVIYTIPSLCVFYLLLGKLEHKTWEDSKAELRQKFLPTYVTATMFWPAVQVINFRFVSPVFRVSYVSVASYAWLTFLSYIKNQPKLPTILRKIKDI